MLLPVTADGANTPPLDPSRPGKERSAGARRARTALFQLLPHAVRPLDELPHLLPAPGRLGGEGGPGDARRAENGVIHGRLLPLEPARALFPDEDPTGVPDGVEVPIAPALEPEPQDDPPGRVEPKRQTVGGVSCRRRGIGRLAIPDRCAHWGSCPDYSVGAVRGGAFGPAGRSDSGIMLALLEVSGCPSRMTRRARRRSRWPRATASGRRSWPPRSPSSRRPGHVSPSKRSRSAKGCTRGGRPPGSSRPPGSRCVAPASS